MFRICIFVSEEKISKIKVSLNSKEDSSKLLPLIPQHKDDGLFSQTVTLILKNRKVKNEQW